MYDINEYKEVNDFMNEFFSVYYSERDSYRVAQMASEDIISVGLLSNEIGHNRSEFYRFVKDQTDDVTINIPYQIEEYSQHSSVPGVWHTFVQMSMKIVSEKFGIATYNIRLTSTVEKIEGEWKISSIHCSEVKTGQQIATSVDVQKEIGRIMSDIVPGGIISHYLQEGFPISIANEQLLKILGYGKVEELLSECNNQFIQLIHPDDLEKYLYTVRFISVTGKQCECEYRIRRKNQTYVWVHDTGRKSVSVDGRDLVISILTDMTEQKIRQMKLEAESKLDPLTNVYNRKGALENDVGIPPTYNRFAFFIVDIDNFKQVNDLYGHVEGDQVLVFLAGLLKQEFTGLSIICRLGGDEFSVFIADYDSIEALKTKFMKIIDNYLQYMSENCSLAKSSLSVGGVYGHKMREIKQVYEKADRNMYSIKYTSKNGICLTEYPK